MLHRMGRSVIGWSAWRREGAIGLAPVGLWVGDRDFRVTQRRAPGRASPPLPVKSPWLAGRFGLELRLVKLILR